MARRLTSSEILTRAEAAQALGVHPATVARWAAGERPPGALGSAPMNARKAWTLTRSSARRV